jgi:hypothetical protein
MPNLFINLPVPAFNDAGVAVDTSEMGGTKTIIVGGPFQGTVTIEYANDDAAANWAPVPNGSFVNQPGRVTIDLAVKWMRARMDAYKGGLANADVGASNVPGAGFFVPLGPDPVDISEMPPFKTVVASGACNVEISEDGNSWSQAFSFQNKGGQSGTVVAQFARVTGGASAWLGATDLEDDDNEIQPPFRITQKIIYVRTDGSDSGSGTLDHPYATLPRAVRDIPLSVPAGSFFIIDITGVQNALPPNYTLPPWKAAFITAFVFDLPDPGPYLDYFLRIMPVNIWAVPERAALPPGEAEFSLSDVSVVDDPRTGMSTITLLGPPRPSWGANALRGKFLHGTGGPFDNTQIWESDATSLKVVDTLGDLTGPFRIEQQSATLTCEDTSAAFAMIQSLNNEAAAFGGIKFDGGGAINSLDIEGFSDTAVQLCDIENPYFGITNGADVARFLRNYIHGDFSYLGIERLFWNRNTYFGGPDDTKFTGVPAEIVALNSVFDGGHSIIASNTQDGFTPAIMGSMWLGSCVVRNSVDSGVASAGGFILVESCDLYGNAGDGVAAFGPGLTQIVNSGSSGAPNGGVGVSVFNGAQVQVDAATSGAADPLTGTAGDTIVGSVGVTPWATVAAPPNNVPDFAGPAATGARLFQQ